MASHLRTLTFGDRSISYNDSSDVAAEPSEGKHDTSTVDDHNELDSSIYTCSDIDSGVGEDVCCDERRDNIENVVENERKIIRPDVSAIRELTNFDEVIT